MDLWSVQHLRRSTLWQQLITRSHELLSPGIVTKLSFTAVLALSLIGVLDPSLLSAEDNTFIKNQVANEWLSMTLTITVNSSLFSFLSICFFVSVFKKQLQMCIHTIFCSFNLSTLEKFEIDHRDRS